MRLTKIKLAGFKSFVDPTSVNFPGNLTGVVGPNGCGKSNVIDAVRWVMGELSARHLRGDSMADVIFNGSTARKPVGTASVELVFDNTDGKIGGAYASYNEISLKRLVSRDGSSVYFINGARCRRKDITQLFLGTGLGSRSYAIIEQGMISRIIEAKPEDMRAFIEEAAGISRYKERRRETESRVAETRENLERLQDLRDEVEKQIRHLQRQAATARRYQGLKEQERRLTAELLALRLRELDSGAEIHDSTVRAREVAMQGALAEQRAAEAAVERQRSFASEQGERLNTVQSRYYQIGADITRAEQSLSHARELRDRRQSDLAQAEAGAVELETHIARDETELAGLEAELRALAPELETAQAAERHAREQLESAEQALHLWQQDWESFNTELGSANQLTQVERARIEQLENQLRRLTAQSDRLAIEMEALGNADQSDLLGGISSREAGARHASETLAATLVAAQDRAQALRLEQLTVESRLEASRAQRERARAELLSLEALQKAALGRDAGAAVEWLAATPLANRPRATERIEVAAGWERAIETVLGDDLEAVCVERLETPGADLGTLASGRLTLIEERTDAGLAVTGTLAEHVTGPAALVAQLSRIRIADSLASALELRSSLAHEASIITRAGEWVGRDWLRISRGSDPHAGVIEREHRLKALRTQFDALVAKSAEIESHLQSVRQSLAEAESERDAAQAKIQHAHRDHADLIAQLESLRARTQEASLRRDRITEEEAEVRQAVGAAREELSRSRLNLDAGLLRLSDLDARRPELESVRDERREAVSSARARAQAAQLAARDRLVRQETRRAAEQGVQLNLSRMREQLSQLTARRATLQEELARSDAPIRELAQRLEGALSHRVDIEAELTAARGAMGEAENELRSLDERRMHAERRALEAREAMEQARLAAQETHVRRESLAEQFTATQFELPQVLAGLAPDATVESWETALTDTKADLDKLGQVNLAAIDELKEQSERKEYLDRQYTDLTDALATLDQAMKRIDKETRTRFEDTFERVNAGLKDKFPRLFGGGHAYLELVGEDPLAAGVAVMARPPGKRNSTIHLLSGGEKALTAVALVFSIFDLNPAPFCLLDEVDAPLDEHNVGRFCDIVRDMSSRVQFIFITHNKATMELAAQLIGVTMNEPGVSRLVAVDVDEAVRLAAV